MKKSKTEDDMIKYIFVIGLLLIFTGAITVSVPLYTLDMHENITIPIKQILSNDGYQNYSDILSRYESQLINGVRDEDNGINEKNHFFNPVTKTGLGGFKSSAILAQEYFTIAKNYWKEEKERDAIYYLGRTLHLIQDSTVPHHAVPTLFDGHLEYEKWLEDSGTLYTNQTNHGNYQYKTVYDYIYNNSIIALSYFQYCDNLGTTNYLCCADNLIPLAQENSAGIVVLFFEGEDIAIYNTVDQGDIGLISIFIGIILCLFAVWKR